MMAKSTVVDGSTGRSVPSEIRTSSGTFFRVGQDPIIADIERRIAEFTMIPEENGEGIQILRYEHGQKYEAHFDYFHDQFNARPETGGNRLATLLMYLCARPEPSARAPPRAPLERAASLALRCDRLSSRRAVPVRLLSGSFPSTDVEEGGETVFPNSHKDPGDTGALALSLLSSSQGAKTHL